MSALESCIKQIIGEAKEFAVDQLEDLIEKAKNDREAFIQKQAERLQTYIQQLAERQLSKSEFEDLITDLVSLEKIEFHKLSAEAKIRAEEVSNGILEMVLKGLVTLI